MKSLSRIATPSDPMDCSLPGSSLQKRPHPKAAKQSKTDLPFPRASLFAARGGSATQWLSEGHGGLRVTRIPYPQVGPRFGSRATTAPHRVPSLCVSSRGRLNRPRGGEAALGLRWGHREPRSLGHHWSSAVGSRMCSTATASGHLQKQGAFETSRYVWGN